MKNILCLLMCSIMMCCCTCAQDKSKVSGHNDPARYELYATDNMWTFLKLDTRTGLITQVQYSVQGADYRYETYLNLVPLVLEDKQVNGRFTMVKTSNMYNFILLDQIDGDVYQVQWASDPENRGVLFIENKFKGYLN